MQFIISETDEVLVPQAGLALVGALLQGTSLRRRVNTIHLEDCPQPEVKHAEVVTAGIGLLCLGKSDFNDLEAFRDDKFFCRALGLRKVPSEATLRQRLDMLKDQRLLLPEIEVETWWTSLKLSANCPLAGSGRRRRAAAALSVRAVCGPSKRDCRVLCHESQWCRDPTARHTPIRFNGVVYAPAERAVAPTLERVRTEREKRVVQDKN